MKYSIIIIFIFNANILLGCSCRSDNFHIPIELLAPEKENLRKTDTLIAFQGTLLDVEDRTSKYREVNMTFLVNRNYFGSSTDTINIITDKITGASCGLNYYYEEKEWIIVARKTSNGYYTNDCCKSLNKLYDNYYEDFKRFFEVVSEKREGTHDFYDHYKGETYLALRISYYGKWLNGDWELRNTKAQLIEKGKYLYDKRTGQWQINRYKEPSYTDKDRQVIKRFYQYREDKIHSSMTIYQTFDGETNKLKEERIKCIGEVNVINEYDEEGRIKTQKHSLKEFNRTRN